MRKYETKMSEPRELKVLTEVSCDLCGKVGKNGTWESSYYEKNEVEIEMTVRSREGVQYPDLGYGTDIVVDICPDCFKNTLIPFLKEKGANIKETEWEW